MALLFFHVLVQDSHLFQGYVRRSAEVGKREGERKREKKREERERASEREHYLSGQQAKK